MITSQDRLQPMDERRLTHQGDHGYPSDCVFLLLHLWVLSGANGSLQTE
jgi:hypothetical protein